MRPQGEIVTEEIRARRPIVGPFGALALIAACWAFVAFALEGVVRACAGATFSSWVALPGVYIGFDMAIGLAVLIVVLARLRREARVTRGAPVAAPPLSVLVAAYNEAAVIGQTLEALIAQRGVELEVLVGDDGSTDGTLDAVIRRFACTQSEDGAWRAAVPRPDGGVVHVVACALPHAGKGAALNALAKRARHAVLVTLDADTTPAEGALAAMARAFCDPGVVSAAGVVGVRNAAENLLTRYQAIEYQRITWVRAAWATLGALEQVPGAFTGVRADAFAACGGFPTDSLTEDYELTYRLVDQGARTGRVPHVAIVLDAQVWTEVPATVAGLVRQRTRWFTGFLTTLARFPHLIFNPRAAAFGLVRLPLKLVDAIVPLFAFASLAALFVSEAATHPAHAVLSLFAARWAWDTCFYAVIVHADARMARPDPHGFASSALSNWSCLFTESLAYSWLRHAATLRAYSWSLRRIRTWEPSREPAPAELAN